MNRLMKYKISLLSIVIWCCCSIAFAEVSVRLEAPKIQYGQTFRLTLTIEGRKNAVPDLMPLQQDFTIVGTESNLSYTVTNGQSHSTSEWTILLTAKRSGILPIPAIQIGQEKTVPTTIEITNQAPDTNSKGNTDQQDIMLQTDVSLANPYVNQQVIFTVKLYNSSRLLDANYQPPQVEDALFVPFGNGRRYQVNTNGRLYAVEEQQFALFPQKSGELTITPPSFNALIYDTKPRRINVQTKPIMLKVQAIPAQYKGKDWLPAKQVTLSESYDKNTSSLLEGSTLVRIVTLEAVAVPAQLLPKIDFGSSDKFSIYPEQAVEKNTFKQQDVVGKTTVKVTYLLNTPGTITIPAIKLPWFNVVTGKEELSVLSGFTIEIRPAAGRAKPTNAPVTSASPQTPKLTPLDKKVEPQTQPTVAATGSNLPWWLAGGFALAWLLTILAWRWHRPLVFSASANKKEILKQLALACSANHAEQARDALLKWGRLQWPKVSFLNLIDLANWIDEPTLKEQIQQLAQFLYQNSTSKKSWQGDALWQAMVNFKDAGNVKKVKKEPLPPIHRI